MFLGLLTPLILLALHVWLAWWASGVGQRKGYPRVLGFLLAFCLPLAGTVILLLLPPTKWFENRG